MNQETMVLTISVCATLIICTVIVVVGWVKREQQQTIRKAMEKGAFSEDELRALLAVTPRYQQDLRRGLLLSGTGLVVGVVLFFMGGVGWMFAAFPLVLGLFYLLLWRLHAPK